MTGVNTQIEDVVLVSGADGYKKSLLESPGQVSQPLALAWLALSSAFLSTLHRINRIQFHSFDVKELEHPEGFSGKVLIAFYTL